MCAEKIEEIPDANSISTAVAHKVPSAWGPALTVLVLLPILSFALAEFILFPRLQNKFEQTVGKISMTEKAVAQETTSLENMGGEKTTYEIKDIMSNVGGETVGQVRHARVSLVLEGRGENFSELMKRNEARFIDTTLDVFSALSIEDLNNPNVKNIVKNQLLQRFEEGVGGKYIDSLFFSQFIIK